MSTVLFLLGLSGMCYFPGTCRHYSSCGISVWFYCGFGFFPWSYQDNRFTAVASSCVWDFLVILNGNFFKRQFAS